MKKLSINDKNNNILLNSLQISRNIMIKNNTMTPNYKKNFFESSFNSITGEIKQKKFNSNNNKK